MNSLLGDNFPIFFGMLGEGAYCVDRSRRILHWNKMAEDITGYAADEVIGRNCYDNILQHIDCSGRELCADNHHCPLFLTMEDGLTRHSEVSLLHKNGQRIPVRIRAMPICGEGGRRIGALELFSEENIVDRLRHELDTMSKAVYADVLTGLPNRRYIEIRMQQSLEEWERYDWPFACFVMDIDYFKRINDKYGHDIGDQAICAVMNSAALACRGSDSVGRWGSDEAVAVIKNVDEKLLADLLGRVVETIRHIRIGERPSEISATVSIGASLARKGDTVQSLLKRADCALYASKNNGRDRFTLG
jgi:PAS domain S-box/diguanylate cyclase (GGDEF) domain